jgi:hypothetical protein
MASITKNAVPGNGDLRFHPLADIFPLMEGEEFDALVADIKANALRQKIVLYEGKILDGRNRYRAMLAAGHTPRDDHFCRYKSLVPGDTPLAYVIRANLLRRHLTAEQRRELIAKLLKAAPEKSDRQIAETVKASPTTVGTVRAEMEAKGEVSKLDTRLDRKGVEQPAKKPKANAAKAKERRESARAHRAAKRKQEAEESRRRREAEETPARAKAAALAADLIKAGLAQRVYGFLAWDDGEPMFLSDALADALGVKDRIAEQLNEIDNIVTGNGADPEQSADKRREEFAALDAATDGGAAAAVIAATTPKKKRGRPKGSKNKPKPPTTLTDPGPMPEFLRRMP